MNSVTELNEKEFVCSCCNKVNLERMGKIEYETVDLAEGEFKESVLCDKCSYDYEMLKAGLQGHLDPIDLNLMFRAFELSSLVTHRHFPDEELYLQLIPKIYQVLALKEYSPDLYEEITQCLT